MNVWGSVDNADSDIFYWFYNKVSLSSICIVHIEKKCQTQIMQNRKDHIDIFSD